MLIITSAYRRRLLLVAILLLGGFGYLGFRLYQIQLLSHEYYRELAQRQQSAVIEIAPQRGDIVDRNGKVLATSTMLYSVYCEPQRIRENEAVLARRLSSILYKPYPEILDKLSEKKRKCVVIARQLSLEQAKEIESVIKENKLPRHAIFFRTEGKRVYPYDELLAPLLGYVVLDDYGDNRGMSGVEYEYDKYLRGETPRIIASRGAGRILLEELPEEELEKSKGYSLELTIDGSLQYIAESELRRTLIAEKADAGCAVVIDVMTGEVLAMASLPSFNPNAYKPYPLELRRNNAISSPITPGSAIKVFTYSTLLENSLVDPDEMIDCGSGGPVYFYGRAISDVHPLGWAPVRKAFSESSNIGTSKLAERLTDSLIYNQFKTFGFGEKTGIDLPGEDAGVLYPIGSEKWSALSRTSLAIGYEIEATALQMVLASAAIANNGYMMKPYVVRRVINARGEIVKENKPQVVRRVIRPTVTQQMLELMEGVVREGTGTRAQISGYRVGGKTGTARKVPYSQKEYISSFVGVLPLEAPRICIYVWIDNPRRHKYGGEVAAPVFKKIAEAAIKTVGLPPTEPITSDKLQVTSINEPRLMVSSQASSPQPAVSGVIPDLYGLTMREALKKLAPYDVNPCFVGSGVVVDQSPPPGKEIKPGTKCLLVFSKLSEKELAEAK